MGSDACVAVDLATCCVCPKRQAFDSASANLCQHCPEGFRTNANQTDCVQCPEDSIVSDTACYCQEEHKYNQAADQCQECLVKGLNCAWTLSQYQNGDSLLPPPLLQ